MTIIFTLSMPGNNSWNGRWSGQGNLYAVVHKFGTSKKTRFKLETLLDVRNFGHNFGDGWRASVEMREASPGEAKRVRKSTKGFCGYEWMISNILDHGTTYDKKTELEHA